MERIHDDQVLSLSIWASDHIVIPWIQQGKFFSAKFEDEGDKMCAYKVVFHG
jgi:8-oxo-dGTP diphosphatase